MISIRSQPPACSISTITCPRLLCREGTSTGLCSHQGAIFLLMFLLLKFWIYPVLIPDDLTKATHKNHEQLGGQDLSWAHSRDFGGLSELRKFSQSRQVPDLGLQKGWGQGQSSQEGSIKTQQGLYQGHANSSYLSPREAMSGKR